ncbi:MAG TPA: N-6 DNA methylase [Leptospiraceae bacterium]|nr:N-6 DNA methylase [Leptospiraceae bacterium]HNM03286.1 N-6 DNA methylase [Leptospiraceae bacterium]HNN02627.1 N-6 DNA methylase [Leptospiraceae bacterium]
MDIAGKLWNFCNKLRHDGVDSSDYIEQLTYLLFLKMAEEKELPVPNGYNWQSLLNKENGTLVPHLEKTLNRLKNEEGILGQIFAEPIVRVKNGEVLKALIKEIDEIQWTLIDADIVGSAFEELIGRVANEGKKGAGQYFTPRPLIQAIVNVIKPNPFETSSFKISDVACGTAGFLVVASEWIKKHYYEELKKAKNKKVFSTKFFHGKELVQRPRRLALMNLFLHGIDASETLLLGDSIDGEQDIEKFDVIITNPPFGNKGASPTERNFPIKTSDKQLNFIQHIVDKLKDGGRAAIVLPDSCLSSDKAKEIWKYYLDKEQSGKNVCNVHTILKLPEGVFAAYANGVKACVVFFEKSIPAQDIWVYDARTNMQNFTKKNRPLSLDFFSDFEKAYGIKSRRRETERFKRFTLKQIKENDFNMDFKWLKENNFNSSFDELSDPKDIIEKIFLLLDGIKDNLEPSLEFFKKKRSNGLSKWENHKLNDILTSLESGSRPKGGVGKLQKGIPSIGGEHLDSFGSFDFSNIKYVSEGFADLMVKGKIVKNDILIVKDGATTGKVSFVDYNFPYSKAVVNEHIFICKISKYLSAKYFFWYLRSEEAQEEIKQSISGLIGGINHSFSKKLEVPTAPIKEQEIIVNALDTIFENLLLIQASILKIPKALEKYRDTVLEQAISGKLTEDWREKNKSYKGWLSLSLKDIAEIIMGISPPGESYNEKKIGVPLINGPTEFKDLPWAIINEENIIKYTTSPTKLSKKNDLIICVRGSTTGRTNISGIEACIGRGVAIVRSKNENEQHFLNLFFYHLHEKILQDASKGVATFPSISQGYLANIEIKLPSLEEQQEIVSRVEKLLSKADEIEKDYHKVTQYILQLQKSVLQMAFNGELSEPQPGDEPVSVLLERIKEEKETLEKERKMQMKEVSRKKSNMKREAGNKKTLEDIIKESESNEIMVEEIWLSSRYYETKDIEGFYENLNKLVKSNFISKPFFIDSARMKSAVTLNRNAN